MTSTTDLNNNKTSTFDRSTHEPYRLDKSGLNKEASIRELVQKSAVKNLAPISAKIQGVKIPSHWKRGDKTNPNRSLTELEGRRKQERQADPSYDLDGDGIVGNRDMYISKLFDKDRDGKLNAVERRNAEEAIRNVSLYLSTYIITDRLPCVYFFEPLFSHIIKFPFFLLGFGR